MSFAAFSRQFDTLLQQLPFFGFFFAQKVCLSVKSVVKVRQAVSAISLRISFRDWGNNVQTGRRLRLTANYPCPPPT